MYCIMPSNSTSGKKTCSFEITRNTMQTLIFYLIMTCATKLNYLGLGLGETRGYNHF